MSDASSGSESDTETTSSTEGETTTTGGPGGTMSESESDATTATTSTTTSDPTNTSEPADCGDGDVQPGEQCDDGNDDNNDGCTNACQLPMCGDGYVGPNEECDDGNKNDDDGCNTACARDRVVFVTSKAYSGNLSGLSGATSACVSAAATAGLEHENSFRPWLSDSDSSPIETFFQSNGRYVLVDKSTVVADDWSDLTDGDLQSPIDMTEYGELLGGRVVWSNTLPWGSRDSETEHCDDWTVNGVEPGLFGYSLSTDGTWSSLGEPKACSGSSHLYCLEQE
ncbi:MAG: DUF4215 domain-containing protein [Myxococcales bacterium]|nr:DUF4215 domain-containing protein [Myxococcales bacterium]MCB9756677.1 DUF4215 domain-containing protein [Myxococcales bacterium]